MRRFAAVLAMLLLAACGRGTLQVDTALPRADYSPSEKVRVMLPPPGKQSEEGGRSVSGRIVQVLQQTHADVQLLPTTDAGSALADARSAQAAYLIEPAITAWSQGQAPPFTADHLTVRMELVNVTSGAVVSAVTFDNTSSLFSVSDAPPQNLLDARFDEAVRTLMGIPH